MMNLSKLAQNNTFIKIISFIAAFSLWLYVMSDQNPSINRNYTVNLEKRNVPGNLVVLNEQMSVRVKVSAARSVLTDITSSDIRAYVDLTGIEKGIHEKQIFVAIPPELQFIEVSPQSVSISMDSKINCNFPVNIMFDSNLPEELTVRTVALEPNVVVVQGAESAIDRIDQLEAVCSFDKNMNQKGQYKITVVPVARDRNNNVVGNIAVEPASIVLTIEIIDNIVTKEVPVKLAYTGILASGHRISATTVVPDMVTLTGPSEKLKDLNEVYVKEININYLNNHFSAPVLLNLPDRVTADVDSIDVSLTIDKE